jgi:hypothetical protein
MDSLSKCLIDENINSICLDFAIGNNALPDISAKNAKL